MEKIYSNCANFTYIIMHTSIRVHVPYVHMYMYMYVLKYMYDKFMDFLQADV